MSTDSTSDIKVVAVVGPTAVGKSRLAEGIAVALGGEIVSCDSMQVYRGMDIGTAKPPEPRKVPHHCLDLVDPGEAYSAALYQAAARDAIDDIASRDALPILAGGTGLYVRAALDDWEFPTGHADTETRQDLERDLATEGAPALHARLAEVDPTSAELIHPNNGKRVIRALEIAASGGSYAQQAAGFSERRAVYDAAFIGLDMERSVLYERIEARVDVMMEAGLLAEVRRLLESGFRDALTSSQAIGYKEFVPVLEDDASLEDAVSLVKQATRRYAKRQLTWFRADPRIAWIDATGLEAQDCVGEALALLSSD